MKYSFMTFSCPNLTLDSVLELAKRVGYDGVEPRVSANHAHGLEFNTPQEIRREARTKFESSGIAPACVATSCRYADPANNQKMIDDTLLAIDLAADIGSNRIRVFGGKIGEGLSREEAIDLVAESLLTIADHAQNKSVVVCMETHDAWCDPKNVSTIMDKVNHPAIAVNWDIMHPVRTENATIDESFEILEPWIKHLHIHDASKETGKLAPIGTGFIDHRRAMELLMTTDFDGYMSGEWINWEDPFDVHLPRELKTLKDYEDELK
ncbi:TIM barrel protein [Candidatus Poribacteria bacterium]|nr:TIM barrel protein [Candidatus Poribacteria bacterium]